MSLKQEPQQRTPLLVGHLVGGEAGLRKRRIPIRSRGWTPLKYPPSAILSTGTSVGGSSFPLHDDVLLAAIRELLILDSILDAKTLEIFHEAPVLLHDGARDSKRGLPSSTFHTKRGASRGRKRSGDNANLDFNVSASKASENRAETHRRDNHKTRIQKSSAEELANSILESSLHLLAEPSKEVTNLCFQEPDKATTGQGTEIKQRPRTVSEADQSTSCFPDSSQNLCFTAPSHIAESTEISRILNLKQKNSHGLLDIQLPLKCSEPFPDLIHVSIADEEILREASTERTERLVRPFTDHALRSFFGYKILGIERKRLVQLLSGLLFDASHAMYAWEQTEKEIRSTRNNATRTSRLQPISVEEVDSHLLESLFGGSERALNRVGGFDPSSLLPNAVWIGRLRRQRTSWTYFASTVRGIRMLEHHKCHESQLLVGKKRRGHRLRQGCHLLRNSTKRKADDSENVQSTATSFVPASSSVSVASDDESKDVVTIDAVGMLTNATFTSLLERMPGCLVLSIMRPDGDTSWGVGLIKEGDVCVVGRVGNESPLASNDNEDNLLVCGDLILYAQNEHGKFVYSPACSVPLCLPTERDIADFGKRDDWFRTLVDLFKNSQELQVLVKRVT